MLLQKKKTKKPLYKNCKIFIYDKKNTKSYNDLVSNIKNVFNNTDHKRIGVDSSNAYALIVKGYKENKFVIKIPRRTDGTVDSLKYEYIAGCDIRHKLCPIVPNFEKVYGYLNKNGKEYLIIERVLPGISLREYFSRNKKLTKETKSLILQILCALAIAQNKIEFVHYDLHFGNVLIREYSKDIKVDNIGYIFYDKNGNKHKVECPVYDNKISVIIDYGRSRSKDASKILHKKPEMFKCYKFLLDKHNIDIRNFDRSYDTKRLCSILNKYIDDCNIDIKNITEPYDAIKYFQN